MALTPEDVRNKLFTTVRLREGYEQTEVDEFLDEVEAELTRLRQENQELQNRVGAGPSTDGAVAPPVAAPAPTPTLTPARPSAPEIVVRTSGDVSVAAARVLEMAQRTAGQFVGEAREEADKLVTNARTTAETLTSEARAAAEKPSTEARAKAGDIDRQTHERTTALERDLAEQRTSVLERLQQEKRRLDSEIETLRSFEREYRGRLRGFLENQLEQLSARANGDMPLAPAGGPVTSGDGELTSDGPQDVLPSETGEESAGGTQAPDGRTAATSRGEPDAADANVDRSPGARSALGRILEEEERKADGNA